MHDLAVEQIGHGREPDMRVRPHIHIARYAGRKIHGAHMVEENERADHPLLR